MNLLVEIINDLINSITKNAEYYFWLLIGILINGGTILNIILYNPRYDSIDMYQIVMDHYFTIILFPLSAFFPYVYKQIFDETPLQSIRSSIVNFKNKKQTSSTIATISILNEPTTNRQNFRSPDNLDFDNLARESKIITDKLYGRAGVYLLSGVLIAFFGLFIFYFLNLRLSSSNSDLSIVLLNSLQRFGILFFVEFIAFFFLRQYSTSMDEFRYFEAIKRKRQENKVIYDVLTNQKNTKLLSELISKGSFYSEISKLNKGETTEFIEAKRLNSDETRLFEKIIDNLSLSNPKITHKRKSS